MRTFSLDWNCVIAVENKEENGEAVRELVIAHDNGQADIALLAVSAAENNRNGEFAIGIDELKSRAEAAGFGHLPILPAPMVFGLSYLGHSYLRDPKAEKKLEADLWDALFPGMAIHEQWSSHGWPKAHELHSRAFKVWRNAFCDIHNLLSHVQAGRDVFVTANTKDYQRRSGKLEALGIKRILSPAEARTILVSNGNSH